MQQLSRIHVDELNIDFNLNHMFENNPLHLRFASVEALGYTEPDKLTEVEVENIRAKMKRKKGEGRRPAHRGMSRKSSVDQDYGKTEMLKDAMTMEMAAFRFVRFQRPKKVKSRSMFNLAAREVKESDESEEAQEVVFRFMCCIFGFRPYGCCAGCFHQSEAVTEASQNHHETAQPAHSGARITQMLGIRLDNAKPDSFEPTARGMEESFVFNEPDGEDDVSEGTVHVHKRLTIESFSRSRINEVPERVLFM